MIDRNYRYLVHAWAHSLLNDALVLDKGLDAGVYNRAHVSGAFISFDFFAEDEVLAIVDVDVLNGALGMILIVHCHHLIIFSA